MYSSSFCGLRKTWIPGSRIRKGLAYLTVLTVLCTLLWRLIGPWVHQTGILQEWNIYRWKCMDFLDSSPPAGEPADHVSSEAFYISHNFHSGIGLGNVMFIYAAMSALAHRNNLTVAIAPNRLHSSVHIDRQTVGCFDLSDCRNLVFGNDEVSIYDRRASGLLFVNSSRRNVSLWGYFQSWRYFHPFYRDAIRRQFAFQSYISQRATLARNQVLEKIYQKLSPNESRTKPVIGIHIRRGDVLTQWWQNLGMVEIPASYFVNAARVLQTKGVVDPLYIVCTNDPQWAEKNLPFRLMAIVRDESPEVDMTILAQSDHLILSYGTFSFWAGYLSNASNVVYYADYPRPGSRLASVTNLADLWLPEWIGVSG